jgi:hypothetical protein
VIGILTIDDKIGEEFNEMVLNIRFINELFTFVLLDKKFLFDRDFSFPVL